MPPSAKPERPESGHHLAAGCPDRAGEAMTQPQAFWPGGARLAMSVSMQLEAGGQPISGAGGPITEPILDAFPFLGQNTFYKYGAREGAPRIWTYWTPAA